MVHWQLLTIDVHYQHADGSVAVHSSTVEERQTESVSVAMAQLIFSHAVWALRLEADLVKITLISIDSEGINGAFLIRATVDNVEKQLSYSRRRGAQFTAELPTGTIYFTNDQMFSASPQVFSMICSTLHSGFTSELPDGWRWMPLLTVSSPAAAQDQLLKA